MRLFTNKQIKKIADIFNEILNIIEDKNLYNNYLLKFPDGENINLPNLFINDEFKKNIQDNQLTNFEKLKQNKNDMICAKIKNAYADLKLSIASKNKYQVKTKLINKLKDISEKYNPSIKKRYEIIIKNIEEKYSCGKVVEELKEYDQKLKNKKNRKLNNLIKYAKKLKEIIEKYERNYKRIFKVLDKKLFRYEYKIKELKEDMENEIQKITNFIPNHKDFFYVDNDVGLGVFMQSLTLNDYIIKCKRQLNLYKILQNKIIKLKEELYYYLDEKYLEENYKNKNTNNYIKERGLKLRIADYEKQLNFYKEFKIAYDKGDQNKIYLLLKEVARGVPNLFVFPPGSKIKGYHGVHNLAIGASNNATHGGKKQQWKLFRGTYYKKSWKHEDYRPKLIPKYYAKRLKKILKVGLHPSFWSERPINNIRQGIGRIYFFSEDKKYRPYGDLYFKGDLNDYCVVEQDDELFIITNNNITPKHLTLCVPSKLSKNISTIVAELKKLNVNFEISEEYNRNR